MRLPLLAVVALLMALAPSSRAGASSADYARALLRAQDTARRAFLSHEPGQPTLDAAVRLPPAPADAGQAGGRGKLESALRDAREVQEGCAQPCAAEADVALYMEKVRQASAALGLEGSGVAAALERYAPRRVPRKRAAPGSPPPSRLDAKALDALMSRRDVSPAARKAFTDRAARIAAALDQRKGPENVAGGGVSASGRRLSAQDRARLIADYRNAPAGDSARLRTLKTHAPPRVQTEVPGLTRMERFALWVDKKVGSDNLQKASDFSAGFGDSMSFGATRWVRKKMGTNAYVDDGSTAYSGGGLAAVAVSLVMAGGAIFKPLSAGVQTIARWAPAAENGAAVLKEGQFVMAGSGRGIAGAWNWLKAGGPELAYKYGGKYLASATTEVPGQLLRYPIAEEGRVFGFIKGLMGQRVYVGPTVVIP